MAKHLTLPLCALILLGFAGLAAAEPAPAGPAAPPILVQPAFLGQAACQQTSLASFLVSAPTEEPGCQGWLYGSCDRKSECVGFSCPLGQVKTCVGGTGSGCLGTCDCVP